MDPWWHTSGFCWWRWHSCHGVEQDSSRQGLFSWRQWWLRHWLWGGGRWVEGQEGLQIGLHWRQNMRQMSERYNNFHIQSKLQKILPSSWIYTSNELMHEDAFILSLGHNAAKMILQWFFLCNRNSSLTDLYIFDGLAQDCSSSIGNALELPQSRTKPSIWSYCIRLLKCRIHHACDCPYFCRLWQWRG